MAVSIDHESISTLKIMDRNGAIKATAAGNIALVGGTGFTVARNDTDGSFSISGDVSAGADIPYYKTKYSNLVNGGAVSPDYSFTGAPYYVASINEAVPHPDDGNMFLLGGACAQLGLFTDGEHPSVFPGRLELFDMCTADVDCEDYHRIFTYLKRLNDFVDSNKDNNLITGTKLFKQYEANVHYWNYLVNSLSLILTAKESNAGLLISAGYRCMDCGPYSGITLSVTVNPVSEQTGLIMAFKGRSMSSNRSTLTGTFSSGTTSFTMAADNDMVLRDYLVANVNFHMSTLTAPPPSGTNIYDVTCVWTNTAFGASVSRTKRVTSSYVSPP